MHFLLVKERQEGNRAVPLMLSVNIIFNLEFYVGLNNYEGQSNIKTLSKQIYFPMFYCRKHFRMFSRNQVNQEQ